MHTLWELKQTKGDKIFLKRSNLSKSKFRSVHIPTTQSYEKFMVVYQSLSYLQHQLSVTQSWWKCVENSVPSAEHLKCAAEHSGTYDPLPTPYLYVVDQCQHKVQIGSSCRLYLAPEELLWICSYGVDVWLALPSLRCHQWMKVLFAFLGFHHQWQPCDSVILYRCYSL